MNKLALIVLMAIVLFSTSSVYADPFIANVEGSFSEGYAVTIQGSGFGEKSAAAPIGYFDFQDGVHGEMLDQNPDSGWLFPGNSPEYSQEFQYKVGDITCKQSLGLHSGEFLDNCRMQLSDPDLNQVYFSGVVYIGRREGNAEFEPKTVKLLSHYEEDYSSAAGHIASPRLGPNSGRIYSSSCETQEQAAVGYGFGLPSSGEWHRIDFWHGFGDDGMEDLFLCVDGTKVLTASGNNPGCDHTVFSLIPSYDDPENQSTMDFYWSSIYLDNTQARVEIGNSPNYEGCSRREIQIPSYWSATEIRIVVNQGSFSAEDPVYLFVVDSEGNSSGIGSEIPLDSYSGGPGVPGKPFVVTRFE